MAVPVDDSMVYAELNKSGVCLGMTGVGRPACPWHVAGPLSGSNRLVPAVPNSRRMARFLVRCKRKRRKIPS